MPDGVQAMILIGFFALVIYSTVFRAKTRGPEVEKTPPKAPSPSPVGLYCEICGEHAGVVSTAEYEKLEPPVYCGSCKFVIERYKARIL
jgi:hypothetical protein